MQIAECQSQNKEHKTSDPLRPRRAVFLDRDGTIIADTGFIGRPEDVRLLDGAIEGLQTLRALGYALIVVTNQSGLARGIFTPEQMAAVRERFFEVVRAAGVDVDDYFCCPHHIQGTVPAYRKECADRKGAPGMLLKGAHRHGILLAASWMIGDRDDDVRAGRAGGARTIRIGTGGGKGGIEPDFYADNLLAASKIIADGDA